ncbi:hypothetical protein EV360DRAFT_83824 [Lentinula raphanica]|nr:hypothetical protein EV360DRAFT_83824 [Lentinula raphanica]
MTDSKLDSTPRGGHESPKAQLWSQSKTVFFLYFDMSLAALLGSARKFVLGKRAKPYRSDNATRDPTETAKSWEDCKLVRNLRFTPFSARFAILFTLPVLEPRIIQLMSSTRPLAADFLVHHVGRVTSASTPSTSATRRDGSNPQGYEPEKKRKRSDSCNLALPECLGLSKKPASLWASPK